MPVIARVQGIATAAGCQLVAMCDLAIASRDARFAVSGVNLGSVLQHAERGAVAQPAAQGRVRDARHRRLHHRRSSARQGPGQSRGRGRRARRRGGSLVASIVAKPRVAIAMGKALFYRQLETGIAAAYDDAGRTMACNMMDACALDGVQAFIDKKKG